MFLILVHFYLHISNKSNNFSLANPKVLWNEAMCTHFKGQSIVEFWILTCAECWNKRGTWNLHTVPQDWLAVHALSITKCDSCLLTILTTCCRSWNKKFY